jgi:nicotinamidase-related amidase
MAMTVPLSGTALLVVDLQIGMFNGARIAPIHAGETLLAHVQAVLAEARRQAMRIIYIRHSGPAGHLLEHATDNWRIHPLIEPRESDIIVDKRTPDAFHDTTLMAELTAAGVKRLIVAGAQSEICVDTTCRRAFSLGFEVTLVSDGHGTWDNDVLTADQIIRHTNQTLAGWFVKTASAAEVQTLLRGSR